MISIALALVFVALLIYSAIDPAPGNSWLAVRAASIAFWICIASLFL